MRSVDGDDRGGGRAKTTDVRGWTAVDTYASGRAGKGSLSMSVNFLFFPAPPPPPPFPLLF